jgi:CheY-like chemotaxis protein/HPt (histidine-containing phosphotransfer) domain-containing protein
MDGRIWVESEVGVGSTFLFTAGFGVQENQAQIQKLQPTSVVSIEELESRTAGLRILLADDSDDNRYLILSYLKQAQVTVEIAENGEIAARMYRDGGYDVVLMDVEMPVMDGYQATSEIRRFERELQLAGTPVLALTAHAFSDMAVKGFEAGFTAMLTKPIRKVTLLEALVEHAPKERRAPVAEDKPVRHINTVQVEEGMEDVVPGYLAKRRAEVPFYQSALGREDYDSIGKFAHKMKGTGSGYGFPMLTEIGTAMEKAAMESDGGQLRECIEQLAAYLESVELKYIK